MNTRYSRRSFFAFSRSALASVGLASWITPLNAAATPTPALDDGVDYYDKLGVAKIINAAGTYTTLTAACMPPVVLAAVQKAALHPVRLHDLQQKAGEYIAQRLKCRLRIHPGMKTLHEQRSQYAICRRRIGIRRKSKQHPRGKGYLFCVWRIQLQRLL